MSKKIVIVDYGVGNLLSVARAFEHCGADVSLQDRASALTDTSRMVLPGVGAFGDCVDALRSRGLDQAVLEHVARGRPLMGICVGMQMLLDASEEFGSHDGLGIIPGVVEAIPRMDHAGNVLKVPHIGWSPLLPPEGRNNCWADTPLSELKTGTAAYFVHSYHARPHSEDHRLADAEYGGQRITASICREAVFGTQFHPEKSGEVGLSIVRRFLEAA
ncbi:imidazole glycerol phosphate synthase subunit HisH (plasmid) [Rhizobium sp. WL3]|uniref:imidazole glycerol phosphate synthase subunit HisH n=1 Tax=Rhizobium sp. WL3 TaxID=2603277 RepID=UPI0011C20AA6|nr:imidazole glycerol phosphate synthase subunit HisH [Rhizobium sp. WL3]QEE43666.1 imidazole glycerol phosphate synthase subunit HisH [Rhizobium sp. WL3]